MLHHRRVQDSLAEVRTLETEVAQYIDLTCKYLISRGELIKKVVKYPHVEDFRRSVQSLDEKQFVSLRFVALELRNHYVRSVSRPIRFTLGLLSRRACTIS